MEKLHKITFTLLLSLMIFSCSKKSGDDPQPSSVATYNKKWNVISSNTQRIISVAPQISSIEFLYASYVVFYDNDSNVTGAFTKVDDQTLTLNGFGTLKIVSLGNDNFNFVLSQTGKPDLTINTSPAILITSSVNTIALCKTWVADSNIRIDEYGQVMKTLPDLTATLSQYGTFVVKYVDDSSTVSYFANGWHWVDGSQESSMKVDNYAYDYTISFSQNNTKLLMVSSETVSGGSGVVTNEHYYTIKP